MSTEAPTVTPAPARAEPARDRRPCRPGGRYRPVWNVQQRTMNIHFCEPGDGEDGERLLAAVLGDLERAPPARGLGSVCIPVPAATLADAVRRDHFVARCETIPPARRELIVWEIVGAAEDAGERPLFAMVSTLKPFGRAVFLRGDLDQEQFDIPAAVGVHSVGVDLAADARPEGDLARALERFAESAHHAGLRCHAIGLATSSASLAAFSCGFDYLAGRAIADLGTSPWRVLPFDAEELFLARRLPQA